MIGAIRIGVFSRLFPLGAVCQYKRTQADRHDAPQSAEIWIQRFPGYGVAELSAGSARMFDQGVAHTPTTEESAHGSVFGKKTKPVKSGLRDAAKLLISPDVPEHPKS